MMMSRTTMSNTAELFARKLQASNLLAALARISLTGSAAPEHDAALDQGMGLLDDLIQGEQLFSDERVTRQLVGEGIAFLAAARALKFEEKDKLEHCGAFLKDTRSTVSAIRGNQPVSQEQRRKLEDFLDAFARILQSDIDVYRNRRHVLPAGR